MRKKELFRTILACSLPFVALGAFPVQQAFASSMMSSKETRIHQIDEEIATWKQLQEKYRNKEYIDEDEALRVMDQDWLQYRENLQEGDTSEQAVEFIQKKIDALEKEKTALK